MDANRRTECRCVFVKIELFKRQVSVASYAFRDTSQRQARDYVEASWMHTPWLTTLLLTNLLDSELAVMSRESVRAFAQSEVVPLAERIHRHDELVPDSMIQKMAGLQLPVWMREVGAPPAAH